jgi:trk system potassium uptake protein TrkA
MKKQILIVGLGVFGKSLALRLAEKGAEVVVIDKNEEELKEIADHVAQAIHGDATDEKTLRSLGLNNIDIAVVSIGEETPGGIGTSILVSMLVKEICKAKRIIAKGINKRHADILYKLGVTDVVFPERDMAERLAKLLIYPSILEVLELSQEYNFAEIVASEKFVDKTIRELDFRAKYNVTILGIRRKMPYVHDSGETDFEEKFIILPSADEEIKEGDRLLVIGKEKDIKEIEGI